jgi:integrase
MTRTAVNVIVPRLPSLPDTLLAPRGEALLDLYRRFIDYASTNRAPKTLANHRRTFDLLRSMPTHPTPGDVATWLRALSAAGMGERTIAQHRWSAQAVYNWGAACALVQGNPFELVPFRAPPPRPRGLAAIARRWPTIAAACQDKRELAFLGTCRFMGLRPGEALALQAGDIDLRRNTLTVERQRTPATWVCRTPKTERGCRILPLRRPLVPLLRAILYRPVRVALGRGGCLGKAVSRFLFPYRPNDLSDLRDRLRLALPGEWGAYDWLHTFRHSFAMEVVSLPPAKRMSIEDLSKWLGHANLATTDDYLSALMGRAVSQSVATGLDGKEVHAPRKVKRGDLD